MVVKAALTLALLASSAEAFNHALTRTRTASPRRLHALSRQRLAPIASATASAPAATSRGAPGTADLPWDDLGFEFRETRSHMKFTYKDGKWDGGELVEGEPYIKLHIANTALHYGQSVFEGMKAFAWEDGSVHIFRPDENCARMTNSANRIMMPMLEEATFVEGVSKVVADNRDYVPAYGSGGALYIRPILFGSGARIGLSPADEYTLLIMVIPVGNYYKDGMSPVPAIVVEGFDRAAPQGVGDVKCAGNYAADLYPNQKMKSEGFPISLYLDARTHTKVEEFSTSNFFGITKDGTYVTPKSPAVLPSITNKSLMQLAESKGRKVERREVPITEVFDGAFTEVAACGTAVVLTPIASITKNGEEQLINKEVGPVCQELYDSLRAIQVGDEPDPFGGTWTVEV